jgi:hypothetical protein
MNTQAYVENLTPIAMSRNLHWGELPNTDRLIEEIPFPIKELPLEIREVVKAIAEAKQVPDVLAYVGIQSSISASCGGLYDVQIDINNTHPITTNFLIICESGDRKTTTDNMASHAINEWQRKQFSIYEEEYRNYQAIKSINRDEIIPEPKLKSLIQGAITPQALIDSLKNHPEIYIASNEGGSFVGSFGMKDQPMNFLSMLNQAWDGSDLKDNTRKNKFQCANNPRATVNLQMQPIVYAEWTGNGQAKGIGTIARCLIARPKSKMGTRFYQEPQSQSPAISSFNHRITQLLDTPRNFEYGYLKPNVLTITPEAKEVWRSFYNSIEQELADELEPIKAWGAKCADNASRLASQFQVFKGQGLEIDTDSMISAIKVMEYFLNEQLRLEQIGELVSKQKMLDWLVKVSQEKGFIIEYEIQQKCPNEFRGKNAVRKEIIDKLIEENYIQINRLDKTYIFVHPELLGAR